jgi:hypothetical protein
MSRVEGFTRSADPGDRPECHLGVHRNERGHCSFVLTGHDVRVVIQGDLDAGLSKESRDDMSRCPDFSIKCRADGTRPVKRDWTNFAKTQRARAVKARWSNGAMGGAFNVSINPNSETATSRG